MDSPAELILRHPTLLYGQVAPRVCLSSLVFGGVTDPSLLNAGAAVPSFSAVVNIINGTPTTTFVSATPAPVFGGVTDPSVVTVGAAVPSFTPVVNIINGTPTTTFVSATPAPVFGGVTDPSVVTIGAAVPSFTPVVNIINGTPTTTFVSATPAPVFGGVTNPSAVTLHSHVRRDVIEPTPAALQRRSAHSGSTWASFVRRQSN
ncbi:hypothetical protein BYT27DRAFT_6368539 [Phlegmacium glaucopus]|nr:hypothetical protein BYT27DRAFT_6368539 [Phlegmacium glaucopus]